ncbi:MAG TPA: hypothetical protein ENI78_00495 [Euryarchaeota archaeon]|nr:hypothetical protein [Euryarchaeota archaeon]
MDIPILMLKTYKFRLYPTKNRTINLLRL